MIKKIALLTLFFAFICSTLAFGQRQFNLTYDSAGRLIDFPSAVARGHKKVCPKLVIPAATIYREVHRFTDLLDDAYTYLTKKAVYTSYYCYFKENGLFDFKKYVIDLKSASDDLKGHELTTLVTEKAIDNRYASQPYLPTSVFLKNLFRNHFVIRIRIGAQTIETIPLDKVSYKNNCFYFEGKCKKIKDLTCNSCGYGKPEELSFQLMSADPLNATIKDWFEERNQDLEKLTPEEIIENLVTMAAAANTADNSFQTAYDLKPEIREWFPYWFWYSEGKLVIDPFAVVNKTGVTDLKDKIKEYDRDIQKLSRQKIFIDSVLANVDYSFRKFPLFKKVQARQIDLGDQILEKNNLKKAAEKELASNTNKLLFLQTKVYLNNTKVVVSDFKHVRPQYEFDAANHFFTTADTKRSLHRVYELPDNEQEYIVVHNLDSAATLKFAHQPAAFKDVEEFTELVSSLLSQLNITDLTTGQIDNVEKTIKTFARTTGTSGAIPEEKNIICPKKRFDNPVYKEIKKLAEDYVNKHLTVFYEKSIFEESDPPTPLFSTQTERVELKSNPPSGDSIVVSKLVSGKESPAFITKVNVGKLSYVSVVLGMAVNQNPIERTSVDTSGGGFKVTTTDNKARAVAGIKIYPFQYYKRDRWLIPRYPLHRISLFGGFELLHPLNNFYLGGGYDIVPGLGISAGKNYYLKTDYKIENGTVTDTFRSYQANKGLYYSVNVNPVLFVQFVKLFFKNL